MTLLLKEKKMDTKILMRIYDDTMNEISKRKLLDVSLIHNNKVESSKKIGKHSFNVHGKLIISDPTYTQKTSLNFVSKVKVGKWYVYYNMWYSNVPNNLILVHEKFIDNNDIKIFKNKTQLSNDIGTLTVMNLMDYPNFKYDDLQMDWYEDNNITYKNKTMINKLSNGYSILSGYGDGTYPLSIGKHKNKIVKIIIDFEI